VEVYTNCDAAELFLNDGSLGKKPVADPLQPVLAWDVPNEPGVVRVVGSRGGKEAARFELATAGPGTRFDITADKTVLQANGADLSHVTIQIVDARGRRVYKAVGTIEVRATGAGELAAMDTGDPRDVTPVQAGSRHAYQGRALAIIRSSSTPGRLTVRASAVGLPPAELVLTVK
jgi:beta-galactosidase